MPGGFADRRGLGARREVLEKSGCDQYQGDERDFQGDETSEWAWRDHNPAHVAVAVGRSERHQDGEQGDLHQRPVPEGRVEQATPTADLRNAPLGTGRDEHCDADQSDAG